MKRSLALTLIFGSIAVAMTTFAGCHSGPKIVPVSGIVLIDGKPLTYGFVQVVPEGYRAATGKIGADGRFTLTTTASNDGCIVGVHSLAVIANESLGPTKQKWHAPKLYASPTTSGLTATVNGPTNDLQINLTWNGKQPFIEEFGKE